MNHSREPLARRCAGLGFALAVGVIPAHASHPPRMPEVQRVLARSDAPTRVVLATRYGGHYVSDDGGETWLHVCHEAVGADDTETYPGLLTAEGALVVSTGLRGVASSANGCDWTEWAPLEPTFIVDLTDGGPSRVLALDGGVLPNRIWASDDRGRSFYAYGTPLPEDIQATSIDASMDGSLVYVAGRGPWGPELLRSPDAGGTWARLLLPTEGGTRPELVGILEGALELAVVLVHDEVENAATTGGTLMVSEDGGFTWRTLYSTTEALTAAALADDGTVFFGGPETGLWRTTVGGRAAERLSDTPTRGLTWSGDRLFSVGQELEDGYSVAVSVDGGYTFTPFFRLCDASVGAACASDSSVGLSCSSGIETEAWQPLGDVCDPPRSEPQGPPVPRARPESPASSCAQSSGSPSSSRGTPWSLGYAVALAFLALRRQGRS